VIDPSDGQPFDEIQRSNATTSTPPCAPRASATTRCGALAPPSAAACCKSCRPRWLEHADELAALEQRDCGKPTKQARPMPLALARYFEFYAGACDKLHGETIPYLDGYSVLTWREPHGVTGHIIPWNYPMQIFGRSVGGALAAGNVCVVKPAEDACLSLIRVAQLAAEVGFPPAPSTSSPATATRWATRWRATRASTTSASPAAPRWARSSSRWPPSATAR
jgi:aldehyde dehydrogenase (NAD+)